MLLQGKYRIASEPLGKGNMGTVYEAVDESNGFTKVAVKKNKNLEFCEAFAHEAELLENIRHPAIPRILAFIDAPSEQYLVMEFVEGPDLEDLLEQRLKDGKGPFPVEDVVRWADELLDALNYLHSQSKPVIHRDIKPANLKLTQDGKMKLLDFGLSTGAAGGMIYVPGLTLMGGTLKYAPIEQSLRLSQHFNRLNEIAPRKVNKILALKTDLRSDIFSLGATLFHLLTGDMKQDAGRRALYVWAGLDDPLFIEQQLQPLAPPAIIAVLKKALALDLDDRYQSASEMQQDLKEQWQQHLEETAQRQEHEQQEHQEEIADLLAEKARLEQKAKDYQALLEKAEKAKHAARYERDAQKIEAEKYRLQIAESELRRQKLDEDYTELMRLGSSQQEEASRLRRQLEANARQQVQVTERLAYYEGEYTRLIQASEARRREADSYQDECQRLEAALKKQRANALTYTDAQAEQERLLQELQARRDEQERQLKAQQAEIVNYQAENTRLKHENRVLRTRAGEVETIHKDEIENYRRQFEEQRQVAGLAQSREQDVRAALQKLEEENRASGKLLAQAPTTAGQVQQETLQQLADSKRRLAQARAELEQAQKEAEKYRGAERMLAQARAELAQAQNELALAGKKLENLRQSNAGVSHAAQWGLPTLYALVALPVFNALCFGLALNACDKGPASLAQTGFYLSIGLLFGALLAHYNLLRTDSGKLWAGVLAAISLASLSLALAVIVWLGLGNNICRP